MIYVRKIFRQDLRDGKQIAFPKEPSFDFFKFNFKDNEADRQITFTYKSEDEYDGRVISTRIYCAKSESRIDGQVKAFLRDDIDANVDDYIVFENNTDNTKYTFSLIKQNDPLYKIYSRVIGDKANHKVITSELSKPEMEKQPLQVIYFGSPGTGKSFQGKKQTGEIDENNQEVEKKNVFRTTFHPDTDYATFVGCYKPTMKPTGQLRNINNKQEPIEEISYEFIPQIFTDAYVYAYNNPEEATYLVIEEINRGNCAQIFGDLFQLLDRKDDGTSEYAIKADKDLAKYLRTLLGKDSDGIKEEKLRLPANLHILATMNTSDQSLFPMDSAFKRRWDWEYVPISYTEEKSSKFRITIGDKQYSWVDFIKVVNRNIYDITKSEDKQLGNFFIKSSVNASQFKSKVMFYLWNEVLRDEVENPKYFFYSEKDNNRRKFSFNELFDADSNELLQGFMEFLDVKVVE